jgi:hypothetical protein
VSYEKYPEDAAAMISARVLASRYDFIAFQEVWDEDAKRHNGYPKGFYDKLHSTYPYFVQYLNPDPDISIHEDSGLMFFSRFPFQDLPHDDYLIDPGDCKSSDCDKVAFYEFDSADDSDCLAEKGAALVRLAHPQSHRIYNVVFTHLQAPYYDDDPDDMRATYDTRGEQFDEIETLLTTTLDPLSFQTEEIYFMGDLNVDGDLADTNMGAPPVKPSAPDMFVHNLYEWARQFDHPGAFFTDSMKDMWAFETSPDDRGLSAPRNYEPFFEPPEGRLDYILRNANSRLCTQHMTLSHNLRYGAPYVESGLGQPGTEAGATELSDHIGVTADVNLPAPYCSARAPHDLALAAGDAVAQPGQITYGGSMQWYRFDQPGTYGFAVNHPFVDFQVFQGTDLSMPMANYKDLTRSVTVNRQTYELEMYILPKAPFYVRVFVPSFSNWTGDYQLIAKLYNCSSKADACLLNPQQESPYTFPANTVVGSDDSIWYELHTEATGWDTPGGGHVDTGLAQSLAFEVDRLKPATSADLSLQVRDGNGFAVLAADDVAEPDLNEPGYDSSPTDHLLATLDEPGAQARYLRIHREDASIEQKLVVQWRTNLTVLHGSQVGVPNAEPLDFSIADHGDAVGDEEYYMWLIADGQTLVDEAHLGDNFAEPSHVSLEPYVSAVRYVDSFQAIWVEVDNAYDGGYTHVDDDGADDDLLVSTIWPLDPNSACTVNERQSMSDDEDYGIYYFKYSRCHGLSMP